MPDNTQKKALNSQQRQPQTNSEQNQQQRGSQGKPPAPGQEGNQAGQGATLTASARQQQTSQAVQQQIDDFERNLQSKSNAELKGIANQLETTEREMLLEKIDQELQTIKETVVKPGDAAEATAAAGAASVVINENP